MREDLIERSKFLDVLNYFMRKHPEMPLTEIERRNHLSQGLLIKTAYNNKSNYMRIETFDKYCEIFYRSIRFNAVSSSVRLEQPVFFKILRT